MTIALVPENGATYPFVPGANTYALLADQVNTQGTTLTGLRSYAQRQGAALPPDDEGCSVILLRAMQYIEPMRWKGYKFTKLQVLEWPRYDVNIGGWPLLINEIPWQLPALQCCIALEYFAIGELQPTVLPMQHGNVASEEVSGAVRISYENNGRVLNVAAVEKARQYVQALTRSVGLSLIRA